MASITDTLNLSRDNVTKLLREGYINNRVENERRAAMLDRLDLYRDRGDQQVRDLVDRLFQNAKVKQLRLAFVATALYQNLTRRIINEISMVYSETAFRRISQGTEEYLLLQRMSSLDRKMRLANRYVNLMNECLIWPRIDRDNGQVDIRVIGAHRFYAVESPADPLKLIAVIIDRQPTRPTRQDEPHWLVATENEFFLLDRDGRLVPNSWQEHGLDQIPMVLAHREIPDERLLNPFPGGDLTDAHLSIALLNVLMMKGQKSGTKQAYVAGDLSTTPEGQAMDEEVLTEFGEGVQVSTLDLGVNPDNLISAGREVIKQIAANYGIPLSVFDLSYSATSGFEIQLKRTGLREIRRDQILDYRAIEFELAQLMSNLLTTANHPQAFSMDGWRIDFGELETTQDPLQQLQFWRELRRMGLTNTIEMYRQLNPESTIDQARAAIENNARIESERVQLFRSLNLSPDGDAVSVMRTVEETAIPEGQATQ